MHAAMARGTRIFAEDGMRAGGESLGFIRVAGRALYSGNFCGVGKLFYDGVAIFTAKNGVGAGSVLGRVNRNTSAGAELHSSFAVTGQTFLIRSGRFRRRLRPGGQS